MECRKTDIQDTPWLTRYECRKKFPEESKNTPIYEQWTPASNHWRWFLETMSKAEIRDKISERKLFPNVSDKFYNSVIYRVDNWEIDVLQWIELLENDDIVRERKRFPWITDEYYNKVILSLNNWEINPNQALKIISSRDLISRKNNFPNVDYDYYQYIISSVKVWKMDPFTALEELKRKDLWKKDD